MYSKMDPQIHFVSCLPRSGSTLLLNILGQNPGHYVTPTSGMIEIFMAVKNGWKNFLEFKAEGLEKIKPRIDGALKGIIHGYFDKEFEAGKVVFDKSRGWPNYIEHLEEALGRKVKLLVTVRDVREICASFEKIYRKREIDYDYALGDAFFKTQTVQGRCEHLLSDGGVVGLTINRVRDALARGMGDRLLLIPYRALTSHSAQSLDLIHGALGLEPFEYDFDKIEQITHENDIYHGMRLHVIQPQVKPNEKPSWPDILPKKYAAEIADRYRDINDLAK
jgi:sulfotransferase